MSKTYNTFAFTEKSMAGNKSKHKLTLNKINAQNSN
jgi:hypothetical protein